MGAEDIVYDQRFWKVADALGVDFAVSHVILRGYGVEGASASLSPERLVLGLGIMNMIGVNRNSPDWRAAWQQYQYAVRTEGSPDSLAAQFVRRADSELQQPIEASEAAANAGSGLTPEQQEAVDELDRAIEATLNIPIVKDRPDEPDPTDEPEGPEGPPDKPEKPKGPKDPPEAPPISVQGDTQHIYCTSDSSTCKYWEVRNGVKVNENEGTEEELIEKYNMGVTNEYCAPIDIVGNCRSEGPKPPPLELPLGAAMERYCREHRVNESGSNSRPGCERMTKWIEAMRQQKYPSCVPIRPECCLDCRR
ncbi:MAG: hypothetical protein AAF715_31330 [Myxococcota bacterium]